VRLIAVGAAASDHALLPSAAYHDLLATALQACAPQGQDRRSLEALIAFTKREPRSVTVHLHELRLRCPGDVKALVHAGFLLMHEAADEYRLSAPGAGAFVQALTAGRGELVRYMQRRPCKEVPREQLMELKLRKSKLGLRFHFRDLVGKGIVAVSKRPGGEIIRLQER
jgi:hypothetical protein